MPRKLVMIMVCLCLKYNKDGGNESVSYTPSGINSGGAVEGHAINIGEMPSHNHTLQITRNSQYFNTVWAGIYGSGTARGGINYNETSTGDQVYISKTGNGQAHSHGFTNPTFNGALAILDNMQPYKVVNRWHRVC